MNAPLSDPEVIAKAAAATARYLTSPAKSRFDIHCAVLLAILTMVFFWPVLSGSTFSTVGNYQFGVYPWRASPHPFINCAQSDQAELNYPWQVFISRALRDGEFPFWNPYSFGGQPFFANGSSAVLYPPRLLFSMLFSASWCHDLLSILHVFGAGLAMYFLLREFGCGSDGSLFAAVTWMFGSFNLAWLQLEVVAPVFLFLPLNLLGVRIAFRRRSLGMCVVASVILAACLVAGHLPFMGLTCLVAFTYAAYLALIPAMRSASRSDWREAARSMGLGIGIAVLPALLAAIVLVPTLMAVDGSHRSAPTYAQEHEIIRTEASKFSQLMTKQPIPITEAGMHAMTYTGLAPIPLFMIGALFGAIGRRAGTWLSLSLAAIVFLIAIDTPALRVAFAIVPGFGTFRPLSRLLYLYGFALALLAGLGLDLSLRWLSSPQPPYISWATPKWRRITAAILATGAVGLSSSQLMSYGRSLNPAFTPRTSEMLYPSTPLIAAVRHEMGIGRKASGRLLPLQRTPGGEKYWSAPILNGAESLLFSIESAGGYDSVIPRRTLSLWRVAGGETAESVLSSQYMPSVKVSFDVRSTRFDLLPRLGVTLLVVRPDIDQDPFWKKRRDEIALETIYAGPDGQAYRLLDASPGPYIVERAVAVKNESEAFLQFTDREFDYRRTVLIEGGDRTPQVDAKMPSSPLQSEITNIRKGRNDWSAKVVSSKPGWLVVPDTWSPGWRVKVNGKKAPLFRADYAFRAIRVPAGASKVTMEYHAEGFAAGAAISGGTATALAACMVLGQYRRFKTIL